METTQLLQLPGLHRTPHRRLISVSRRTDVPALYTPWFLRRIAAGYCLVPNPFNPKQVTRVSLASEDVAGLVFWTRDPRPLLPHLAWIRSKGLDFHCLVTILRYPRQYDPGTPPATRIAQSVRRLAEAFGPHRVSWRYDPIILSQACSPAWHLEQFAHIAGLLEGATSRVIVSLLEDYAKTRRRWKRIRDASLAPEPATAAAMQALLPELAALAARHGMMTQSCAQPAAVAQQMAALGVPPGACLDGEWFRQYLGWDVPVRKDTGQRSACLCSTSIDVGMYNSCPRGCVYCYAVSQFSHAKANWQAHAVGQEFLLPK